jgi:hypothetical protein
VTFTSGQFIAILGGSGLLGVAAIITAIAMLRRDRNSDLKDRFDQNKALSDYVDKRVDERVEAAVKLALAPYIEKVEALEKREMSTKSILYAYFTRLFGWDENGRHGSVPVPSTVELSTLGIDLAAFEMAEQQQLPPVHLFIADDTETPTQQNGTPA